MSRTWPVVVALIALVVLNFFVIDSLSVSILPTDYFFEEEVFADIWTAVLAILPIIAFFFWLTGLSRPLRLVAIGSAAILTVALIVNAVELVSTLSERRGEEAFDLLYDAGMIWASNVILFIDYLFLSFCSCTAFGPTDTQTLSRRAKILQIMQASISLIVLAMIAARAINIIETAGSLPA